jgi:hypothetical protein
MKKADYDFILRLGRLARYSFKKLKKRNKRKYIPVKKRYVKPFNLINAPVEFSLTRGNGVQVVKFIKAISHRVLVQQKPVKLNFRKTEFFFVPGAILLFAEINRIVNLSVIDKPITIIDPYKRKPREVLKQIGIHELTGDVCNVVPSKDDVVFWKATKGATQSGDNLGPVIEFVTEKANSVSSKQIELKGLWRGVSEAVINTVEHAYKSSRKDGFCGLEDTKWWMFTQIKDERFSVAVCDLGCGYRNTINHSLPESFLNIWKTAFKGENPDASSVKIAMEYGRSGTKEGNRGKGSKDALSVLSKHGEGSLFILSNTGWVEYIIKKDKNELIKQGDVEIDIGGTIVWWNLPIQEASYGDN